MDNKAKDEMYMRRCIQLAKNGLLSTRPNPMVGAVIVCEDRIIGEGYHIRCGEGHAEVNAFASVRDEDSRLLPCSTIYVSLEPCAHYGKTPPCADLIVSKGVRRVVVGCVDPFAKVQGRGIERIRRAGIEVTVGVLERECRELNRRFFTFNTMHRPYVILKWCMTADGFLDDNFRQVALSSPFTMMLSHKLRAENDAILIGRVTDERDRSRLDVRHWTGSNPMRIVIVRMGRDTHGDVSRNVRRRHKGATGSCRCRNRKPQGVRRKRNHKHEKGRGINYPALSFTPYYIYSKPAVQSFPPTVFLHFS